MGSGAARRDDSDGQGGDERVWARCWRAVSYTAARNASRTAVDRCSLISIARGEQQYFDPDGIPTATEGCKSNALMRCCKDLGIASELWDPRFIKRFMAEYGRETVVEHATTKKRRKHFMRKDDEIKYPFREVSVQAQVNAAGGFKR